jgi:hypothetical protein
VNTRRELFPESKNQQQQQNDDEEMRSIASKSSKSSKSSRSSLGSKKKGKKKKKKDQNKERKSISRSIQTSSKLPFPPVNDDNDNEEDGTYLLPQPPQATHDNNLTRDLPAIPMTSDGKRSFRKQTDTTSKRKRRPTGPPSSRERGRSRSIAESEESDMHTVGTETSKHTIRTNHSKRSVNSIRSKASSNLTGKSNRTHRTTGDGNGTRLSGLTTTLTTISQKKELKDIYDIIYSKSLTGIGRSQVDGRLTMLTDDGRDQIEGGTGASVMSDSVPSRSVRTAYWRKLFQETSAEYHVRALVPFCCYTLCCCFFFFRIN